MNFTKATNSDRVIFLIDFDAFFASCHIIENPSYKNQKIAVAYSEKFSIITAASYAAREFGVKAGMTAFNALKSCPDLVLVKPNFSLYSKVSKMVFEFFHDTYSKKIELASIDECYLDVTTEYKKYGSVEKMAQHILDSVSEKFNITCSIGISTNKFLAKVSSERNKPNGFYRILPSEIKKKLWPLDVLKMFGVGQKTKIILDKLGIKTIGDLANSNKNTVIEALNKSGLILWNRSNGIDPSELNADFADLKSFGAEVTFYTPTQNIGELEQYLYDMAFTVKNKLESRNLSCKTIAVLIKYQDEKLSKKKTSMQQTVEMPISTLEQIFAIAKNNFYSLWNGAEIRLVGVRATNTSKEYNVKEQQTFLQPKKNNSNIETIVDNINNQINIEKLLTGTNLQIKIDEEKRTSKFQKGEFDSDKRRS
ncbi:DNA polymerase IV [Spiroplasma endosymbiont of Othius punctulatus]|uniref:DNA polymerase IV n=1 Tax=Spiroplasma endosymbiont of Othius punctulatus TaxID=3066289 RepID=UPI0030D361E3